MKNSRRLTFIILSILSLSLLAGCNSAKTGTASAPAPVQTGVASPTQAPGNSNNAFQSITVNSTEEVTVTPDIAQVIYGVRTEAASSADCQKKNTENVAKVIETLKGLGIEEASIQTSDYTMYPIYNYSGNTQKITGYEATSTLTVNAIPISSLNSLLSESVLSGINHIQSISYMSSSYDESYQEALKLAMASAGEKAQVLATAGGCSLGGVVSVTENSLYSQARYNDQALASMYKQSASYDMAVDQASVMPGKVKVEVNITVSYQILSQ